jgi:uncharacterized protein YndB with AHSA1/START domain
MSEREDYEVRIERMFAAGIEDVFDAWTSAEVIRRWFHPQPDWETPAAEVDLRVGGSVRVVMRRPDGTENGAHGEYEHIERPHRLVMRWTFDDEPANEQLIELRFAETRGATTVVLVNTRISTSARRDSQERGWRACLDELERTLSA